MAYSIQRAVSDGTMTLLPVSIEYFDREEISVLFDGVLNARQWAWVGTTDKTLSFTPAVADTVEVMVVRSTDLAALRHQFSLGAQFTAESLDESLLQILHIAQEAKEGSNLGEIFQNLNFHGFKAINMGNGTDPGDAVNHAQMEVHDATIVGYMNTTEGYKDSAAASAAAADAARTGAEAAQAAVYGDLASSATGKGGALVGFKQSETGAIARNTLDKLRERHSLSDFGASSVLTVYIPTDYATLQAAINALHPLNLKPNEYVDIVIKSGHALTAGLLVSQGDYSGFRISSEDATVNLAAGFVPVDTATDGVSNYYAVMKAQNAKAPVWNILVNCATSSTLIGRALMYVDQSEGVINSGKGATGATRYNSTDNGAGLYVLGSSVTARGAIFTGNTRGAWITRGALADLESAVFDNSYTIGLYASRGCGVGWEFGSAKACIYGVDANRSMVMAANSDVSNCTNIGYLAENGGILDAMGGSAKNCTNYGASAENSGVVHARNVDASGAGVKGFRVTVGGKLDKTGGTGTVAIAENLQRREGLITDSAIANPMTTSGGTLTFDTTQGKVIQGLRFRSGIGLTIADQSAMSLDMLIGSVEWGCLLIASSDVGNGHPNGIIRYRVGSSPQTTNVSLATVTNITLTTGALTGTTGTAGNFTISTHTDGKIYLENRTGASRSIRLFTSG